MANSTEFFKKLLEKNNNNLNVSILAEVISYNPNSNTANFRPLNKFKDINMPNLINVPILYFSCGYIDIKANTNIGDIYLLIFLDYDSDNLLLDGTVESNTSRVHSLNDAVALPFTFNPLKENFNQSDFEIKDNKSGSKIKFDGNDIIIDAKEDIFLNTSRGSISVNNRFYTN